MRYNKPRRNRFRSNDKNFRRNGSQDVRTGGFNSSSKIFQGRSFSGNGFRPEKLLEKYNNLAKEASSNGDKILSESYYQHADHFLRVVESRNLIQNNSKSHLDNSSIKKDSDNKIIIKDEKNSSSQQPENSDSQQPENIEKI